jgi:hypothetical protein
MSYTLEQLASDIHDTLKADPGPAGKQKLCEHVSKALKDEAFIAKHMTERGPDDDPREVLYEDPELGFCICAHVYNGPAHGKPHDHGPGWAIYGQATGRTEMTDWRIVEKGEGDKPALVEPVRSYTLEAGDAHFYDVGAVHSPKRDAPTNLLRVEGANLDVVERSKIKAK